MALSPGSKLSHYEIVAPLGAGGMGEVYRARDSRLGRDVAVKVLPENVSANPEVRARFEREAKTVSSLNHPHICVLHDVGREGDVDFLVMELIEGDTLADRLIKGPLPAGDVVRYGAQIADALDRAHRAGVVHRDLKPGNVMITRSGAKLMDFGLARAADRNTGLDASGAALSVSPTEAKPLTAEGTIVGTFQYMAPEQLEGHEVDARTDLWALGCVLYEMATGRQAFQAKSQASLIAAIMHTEPTPASAIVSVTPPQLDRIVSACLAKDPDERVQSAHDVKLQLEWLAAGDSGFVATPAAASTRRRPSWAMLAVVAVAAVAVTAAITAMLLPSPSDPWQTGRPQRFIIGSGPLIGSSAPMLSPDGTYVVFSMSEGSTRRIYRRILSSWDMVPIAGTDGGIAPFFSPDGAWIGFITDDGIRKVPANGGAAQVIVSYVGANAGDWSEDGTIYFTTNNGGIDGRTAMGRVPATGGAIETVVERDPDAGVNETWLPEILPGGQTVLFSAVNGATSGEIAARRADGTLTIVAHNAFLSRYADGHLFYRDQESGAVLAAPFDTERLEFTAPAVPLTEAVDANYCFDVGKQGNIVYVPVPGSDQGVNLVWVDRDGRTEPASDMRAAWAQPRVSPDGKRIALRKVGTDCELWLLDIERGSMGRIIHGDDNHDPVWSPDGRRIAFERQRARELTAFTVDSRRIDIIAKGDRAGSPESWNGPGNLLAYSRIGQGTRGDIWVVDTDEKTDPVPFLNTEFDESLPAIHPSGRWIAYVSNEAASEEVYVRSYPDDGSAWQVTVGGGNSPLWSRDGQELYYMSGSALIRVPITTEPSLSVGVPEQMFDGVINISRERNFDVAPDGRFITTQLPGGDAGLLQIRLLVNWPREIERVTGAAH